MDKLDLILQKLERMESQQDELKHIVTALREGQELMTAKLEAFQQESNQNFSRLDKQLRLLESDVDLILQKVSTHEREIHRLKKID